ncbi:MAG TPA: SRPBCC family protein [Nitrolancea sp.]|nr:SRPBCC family protein [Nitrolancea sp.]
MIDRALTRVIPIRVPPVDVMLLADRRLAFEVLTAFDSARASEGGALRVIERQGDRWLIEFHTSYSLWFGRRSTFVTTEWVTVTPPGQIDFTLAKPSGSLTLLKDRFTLDDIEGGCRFRYDSTFGLRGSIFGWVLGKLFVEPLMRRHMRNHVVDVKRIIEARAAKSRIYPRLATDPTVSDAPSSRTE